MLSTAFRDGFVLAATIQDDRELAHAGAGLMPGRARALAEELEAFDGRTRDERHRMVRTIAARMRALPEDVELPPRAAALLLAEQPPQPSGGPTAADLPAPRSGFRATPGLWRTLHRLAMSAAGRGLADEEEEREAAARAEALSPPRLRVMRAIASEEPDPARALGALVLGMEGRGGGDARTRRLRRMGRELALVWRKSWRA